jgi:hypothetical protein
MSEIGKVLKRSILTKICKIQPKILAVLLRENSGLDHPIEKKSIEC